MRIKDDWYVTGLKQAPLPGDDYFVVAGDRTPVGRVRVVSGSPNGMYPVDWLCWPELSVLKQRSPPVAWDIEPVGADSELRLRGCVPGSYHWLPAPSPVNGTVAPAPRVTLNFGRNVSLTTTSWFELFTRPARGNDSKRVGKCRVVEPIDSRSAACLVEADSSPALLGSSSHEGDAYPAQVSPTDEQLKHFVHNCSDARLPECWPEPKHVEQPSPPPPSTPPKPSSDTNANAWSTDQTAAISLWVGGGVALAAGGFLALDAKRDYDRAHVYCPNDQCPPEQYDAAQDALARGWWATGLMALGAGAAGLGAYFWVRPHAPRTEALGPRIERVELSAAGARLRGTF